MKAAIAPLLDVLRPSRKENVIGNINPTGNVQQNVPAGRVWNPADRTPTTIKETTVGLLDNNHLNVEGQKDGAYMVGYRRDAAYNQHVL